MSDTKQAAAAATNSTRDLLAVSIAEFEGFFKSGSVADRNNNPGNLKFARQPGAIGKDERGFAIFSSADAGWKALKRQLSLYAERDPQWTLANLFSYYLGGDPDAPVTTKEGNPIAYAEFVAKKIGASLNDTLGSLLG